MPQFFLLHFPKKRGISAVTGKAGLSRLSRSVGGSPLSTIYNYFKRQSP